MQKYLLILGLFNGLMASALTCAVAEDRNETVGFRQLKVDDPLIPGTPIPVAIWYPADGKSETFKTGPFVMDVALGAPPISGKHPLIVISHGTGGSNMGHSDFALALAKHGYVVAAPEHRHDNYRDTSGVGTAIVWAGRPKDMAQTITALLEDPQLGPVIAPDRIGAIGMSAGGYTVLALIGAQADMSNLVTHCKQVMDDPGFCKYREQTLNQNSGRTARPVAEALPNAYDSRIKAAILLAPVVALFDDDAIRNIKIPVRLYAAGKDEILAPRYHAERLRALLAGNNLEYVAVENAGHFSFVAPFPAELIGKVGGADYDPPGFDRTAWHAKAANDVVDFFNRQLRTNK